MTSPYCAYIFADYAEAFARRFPWVQLYMPVNDLRNVGVPIVGFTWFPLTDQVDWDACLREDNGNVNPVGLYDLHRKPRPVGHAYQKLVRDWGEALPMQS